MPIKKYAPRKSYGNIYSDAFSKEIYDDWGSLLKVIETQTGAALGTVPEIAENLLEVSEEAAKVAKEFFKRAEFVYNVTTAKNP